MEKRSVISVKSSGSAAKLVIKSTNATRAAG
jgi:hypothetical protein